MRKADVTLTANFSNKKKYTNQKCYLPILKFNDEAHRSQKSRISVQNQHLEQLEKEYYYFVYFLQLVKHITSNATAFRIVS